MSYRTTATAFLAFALVSAMQAHTQAPVQTSTQSTAPSPNNDFYSLRGSAAAGDAQAQFQLGNHYFGGVGVVHSASALDP